MNNNIKRTEFSKEFVKGLIDLIWNKGFSPYYSIFSSSLLLSLYKQKKRLNYQHELRLFVKISV